MVNFNGLEDLVVKLEQELVSVTQELSNVKGEIDRVKREYHEETTPKDDKGIRQFMLERAEARFGQNFDKPESIPEVLDELYELTDREVKKESIVLGYTELCAYATGSEIGLLLHGGHNTRILFTENALVDYYEWVGNAKGSSCYEIINYVDIKRVSSNCEIEILSSDGDEYTRNLSVDEDNQKKMQSFLRDILEYVNK